MVSPPRRRIGFRIHAFDRPLSIVCFGQAGCGKSKIVQRLVQPQLEFIEAYDPTVHHPNPSNQFNETTAISLHYINAFMLMCRYKTA
jgi:GTPase SAR1 family protein